MHTCKYKDIFCYVHLFNLCNEKFFFQPHKFASQCHKNILKKKFFPSFDFATNNDSNHIVKNLYIKM